MCWSCWLSCLHCWSSKTTYGVVGHHCHNCPRGRSRRSTCCERNFRELAQVLHCAGPLHRCVKVSRLEDELHAATPRGEGGAEHISVLSIEAAKAGSSASLGQCSVRQNDTRCSSVPSRRTSTRPTNLSAGCGLIVVPPASAHRDDGVRGPPATVPPPERRLGMIRLGRAGPPRQTCATRF